MMIKVEDNKIIFLRMIEVLIEKVFDVYMIKVLFEKWFYLKDVSIKVFCFNVVLGGDVFYVIKIFIMISYILVEYKMVKCLYLIEYIDLFVIF